MIMTIMILPLFSSFQAILQSHLLDEDHLYKLPTVQAKDKHTQVCSRESLE